MLMPTLKSHPAEKALRATASIWYDPSLFNRNPDPSALTAWKTELKPMEVRFIEKAFADHPYTREYGYVLKAERRGWFGKRR
jgi:hypothetical protein